MEFGIRQSTLKSAVVPKFIVRKAAMAQTGR